MVIQKSEDVILAGRDFEHRDRFATGPRPAIIHQALAKAYFGGEIPLAKYFRFQTAKAGGP
jgi:hypothetical protein